MRPLSTRIRLFLGVSLVLSLGVDAGAHAFDLKASLPVIRAGSFFSATKDVSVRQDDSVENLSTTVPVNSGSSSSTEGASEAAVSSVVSEAPRSMSTEAPVASVSDEITPPSSSQEKATDTNEAIPAESDEEDGYPRLSAGLIVAIAFGAVAATAIPLLLCCLCGCVSCIKVDWLSGSERGTEGPGMGSARLARSSSRKSAVDCRHSECGSFHVSVDSEEHV